MTTHSHENLTSFRSVSGSSDRRFGLTIGAVLSFFAIWPQIHHHMPVRYWLLALGFAFVTIAALSPRTLKPLNTLWFRLGMLLAKVTNPVVMSLMYYLFLVPFAWYLRARGRDLLLLKLDPSCVSYWIERDEDANSSLNKQF